MGPAGSILLRSKEGIDKSRQNSGAGDSAGKGAKDVLTERGVSMCEEGGCEGHLSFTTETVMAEKEPGQPSNSNTSRVQRTSCSRRAGHCSSRGLKRGLSTGMKGAAEWCPGPSQSQRRYVCKGTNVDFSGNA